MRYEVLRFSETPDAFGGSVTVGSIDGTLPSSVLWMLLARPLRRIRLIAAEHPKVLAGRVVRQVYSRQYANHRLPGAQRCAVDTALSSILLPSGSRM